MLMVVGPAAVLWYFARPEQDIWQADGATAEDLLDLEIARREDVARRMQLVRYLAPAVLPAVLLCRWLRPAGRPTIADVLPSVLLLGASWLAQVRCQRARRH
jgi:hypothetical protein